MELKQHSTCAYDHDVVIIRKFVKMSIKQVKTTFTQTYIKCVFIHVPVLKFFIPLKMAARCLGTITQNGFCLPANHCT